MDIWAWVYEADKELRANGNERLADLLDDIPSWVVNNHHSKIDSAINEALMLAEKQPNKWIQVFIRHWYLQSQVLHRRNAKGMVSEAVELLDFAHREDTVGCPQSICVVQDLANCYGIADGAGYAEERIAVCEESLTKISPHWPCYDCIAAEYVDALVDKMDYEIACQEAERFSNEIFKANGGAVGSSVRIIELKALIGLKKYDEARKKAELVTNENGGSSFEHRRLAYLALAHAYLGNVDKAIEVNIPFEIVESTPEYFEVWCHTQFVLTSHDSSLNNNTLHSRFRKLISRLIENGALSDAIKLQFWQAEMSLQRKDYFTAQSSIDHLNKLVPKLIDSNEMSNSLDGLEKKLEKEFSNDVELLTFELYLQLEEEQKEQLNLHQIKSLLEANINEQVLQEHFVLALASNGFLEKADAQFHDFILSNKYRANSLINYGYFLLRNNMGERLIDRFTSYESLELNNEEKSNILWIFSLYYYEKDKILAKTYLTQLVTLGPTEENALHKLALLEVELGEFEVAIRHYNRLIEMTGGGEEYHWDRMIPATIIGNWDVVRESAKALEIDLESDLGEINQNMGQLRVQITEDDQIWNLYAKRVSPVSAIITQINDLEDPQFYGDIVVFDAAPLNKLDQVDDDGDRCDEEGYYTYLYPSIANISEGKHFVFALDGVYPGKDNWETLLAHLTELNIGCSVRSGDNYKLVNSKDDEELLAIYAFIAVPNNVDKKQLANQLLNITANYQHPLIWPLLLNEINDEPGLIKQAEIEKQYNIE